MTLTLARPEPITRTGADILRSAKRYIEEHGWTQGEWEDAEGGVCMSGAMHRVCPIEMRSDGPYGVALMAMQKVCGYPPNYNDERGRTIEDVYAAFDRAIQVAEVLPRTL